MIKKMENFVNSSLEVDVDYSEIFYEDIVVKKYIMSDSKLDKINVDRRCGYGIRLEKNYQVYYAHTNHEVEKTLEQLKANFNKKDNKKIKLKKINLQNNLNKMQAFDDKKKKDFLLQVDKLARVDNRIVQVEAQFYESLQNVKIANSNGIYVEDFRPLTRLIIAVIAKENDVTAKSSEIYGISGGYELLDNFNLEEEVDKIVKSVIIKLKAIPAPGGEMPVIIGNGFGAVIFHEACGHSMEATTVARNISILSGKLNQKIASDKVTIIDDGTIKNLWGSVNIDDEGNYPKKNILIENGYLKNYLIDYVNSKKMKMNITGSGRRESYHYAPTSRMNNTYLKPSNDKIEDMISSIKYGLYAKQLNGGSVDTITGDFNFAVSEAYLIENGKITKPVKDASLIGNTLDILQQVEMVSDNLEFGTGWCGSESGSVPVTAGQPTIKVSKILVGGTNE